ncbi:peptide ABC transporter substrate-binding protein [Massilimicrobiota timonensis]|uniref:peptide ABC transporter substrate-binding protein n=1 Tax=Massilimicrobiota timonensis TaxID=1776392 RepID=UPI00101DC2E6|nr:peptide ABC transporter substrate-binding protein [Massilimicrobiota timonensis]
MKKNWFAKAAASVTCLAMLVGCGSGGSAGANEITINLGAEPPEMDSILTTSLGSMNVLRHCVEGLVSLDANDEAVPGMAESWDVSEDQKTYTFHLRKGAKWSNGEEVTAKDFVFAWNQHFNARTGAPYASTWMTKIAGAEDIFNATAEKVDPKDEKSDYKMAEADIPKYMEEHAGWKAIDDYTFQVTFTGPFQYAVVLMAFPSFFPVNQKAYEEAGGNNNYGTDADKLAYNGPFTITSWAHEDSIVLEKNPDYWNAENIKLDKITMRMIGQETTAINEFNNGSIDMIGLTGDNIKQFKNAQGFDDGGAWYFEFNSKVNPFNNAKVRKALTLGVDAQALIDTIVKNDSKVATTFTPPAVAQGAFTEYCGDLFKHITNNDYSEAKALLEEGLKEEGLTVAEFSPEFLCDDSSAAKQQAEFLQAQLKEHLGVTLNIRQVTYNARLDAMDQGDFEIVFAGWSPDYNDPMTYLDMWVTGNGNNHGKWSNAEYDKIIKEASQIADKDAYYAKLKEAEEILAEECPIGFIYDRQTSYVTSDRLKGVVRTAFQDINLNYAYIEE